MKARITNFFVGETLPALWTRKEHKVGKRKFISFDGVTDVTLKFDVVGNVGAVRDFLKNVKVGMVIKELTLAPKYQEKAINRGERKYVFE